MKKIIVKPGTDLAPYIPCVVTLTMRQVPIEDHPRFSKPDVRFRHDRVRKAFAFAKANGVETYYENIWIITPEK